METLYIIFFTLIVCLLIVNIVLGYRAAASSKTDKSAEWSFKLDAVSGEIRRIESAVRSEIATNRNENADALQRSREEQLATARQNRVELREALDSFRKDFSKSVEDLNQVQKE